MENQGDSQKRISTAAFEEHFDISDDDEVAPSQTKITKPSTDEMVNTPKLRERIKILVSFIIVYIFFAFLLIFLFFSFFQNLISMLNAAQRKPTLKVDRIPSQKWFPITTIRHEHWLDAKKNETIHAVKLETENFYFYVPLSQAEILMKQVFGRTMNGEKIADADSVVYQGFNQTDNIFILTDTLEFRIDDPIDDWEEECSERYTTAKEGKQFPTFRVTFRTTAL